ncbi:MAG: sigma-70 family RNA polymerase sigma factor [Acidobacteriota bacterium]
MQDSILQRVAQGDGKAVDDCLDQYGNLIWSLARRHCGTQDDAEDAVQEIFIDLWKSADRFDPTKASEVTFICMIARRRLIDRRRYIIRRPQTESLVSEEGELRDVEDFGANQAEVLAEAALASRALRLLDEKERKVILMSAYQGMSHGQIAKKTGLPLGTVKTYIRRGLMRVKDMLHGDPRVLQGLSA